MDGLLEGLLGGFPAGGKLLRHDICVHTNGLETSGSGVAAIHHPDGHLLNGVAHLVQVPGAGVCPGLHDLEHLVRVDANLGKLHAILADGVQQLPGKVQAVLGAGGNQVHGVVAGYAKVIYQGVSSPDAFGHVVLEHVPQSKGPFRDALQLAIGEAFHLLGDSGHSVGHICHAVAVVVAVDILHYALEAFQLGAGGSRGGGDLPGGGLILRADLHQGGGHRPCRGHPHLESGGESLADGVPGFGSRLLGLAHHFLDAGVQLAQQLDCSLHHAFRHGITSLFRLGSRLFQPIHHFLVEVQQLLQRKLARLPVGGGGVHGDKGPYSAEVSLPEESSESPMKKARTRAMAFLQSLADMRFTSS